MRGDDELAALVGQLETGVYGTTVSVGSTSTLSLPNSSELDVLGIFDDPVAEEQGTENAWCPWVRISVDSARPTPFLNTDTESFVREEVQRYHAAVALQNRFEMLCADLGVPKQHKMLHRWRLKMKYLEQERTGESGEPLLPARPYRKDGTLVREFQALGLDGGKANWFARQLAKICENIYAQLCRTMQQGAPRQIRVKVDRSTRSHVILTCAKITLNLSSITYKKLRILYKRNESPEEQFDHRLFAMVLRYESAQNSFTQATIHPDCFMALRKHLGVCIACFTTPLSCKYERYCSEYRDTDACFGSLGSFFDFTPQWGLFQATPPLVPEIISRLAERIDALLTSTSPIGFIVFVPDLDRTRGVKALRHSKHVVKEVMLAPRALVYGEDPALNKRNQSREQSEVVLVIFLFNEAAAEKWQITPELVEDLCRSFQVDHALSGQSIDVADDAMPSELPGQGDVSAGGSLPAKRKCSRFYSEDAARVQVRARPSKRIRLAGKPLGSIRRALRRTPHKSTDSDAKVGRIIVNKR